MKSVRKRSVPKVAQPVGAWAILAVDGTPLRKKAQREYQKALRDLDSAKAQLTSFHERDEPLFSRWLNQNFGALLTEIRELQAKLFETQQLVTEVEQEYFFGGHRSKAGAYREVLRRRAEPEQPDAPADDEEAELDREFEEAFEQAAHEFWERISGNAQNGGQSRPRAQREKAKAAGSRLKELYRTLARRLHPDKTAGLTENQKEWWHQTQAAYETGNLEQMEMILTLVEIEDKGTQETSISALAKLTASFKSRLRALKRQLAQLRREPGWNFGQREDHSALFHQIQNSLRFDRERLASVLGVYRAEIEKWERAPIAKPRRNRRRVTLEDEFLF